MMQPDFMMQLDILWEIGLPLCGFGGIVLTQWRVSIGLKNEVKTVKTDLSRDMENVEKELKRLADQALIANSRTREIEINCARIHGQDDNPSI
jgi:hypothetical protein